MSGQITINTSEHEIRRAREALSWIGSIDAKRPAAWQQYGYTPELTFDDMLRAYSRGGAGHGAVHRLLDKCWQEWPRIKQPAADKETPWEKKVGQVLASINAWQKLRDFDRRNMVGRYAGLIYRVRDGGKALREPLALATELVDLVPVYENQLKVVSWDDNPESETFGQPTMWQYRTRRPNAASTQSAPEQWANVHPSRVQILAEGTVGHFEDGVPMLEAGFNSLVDLEKITGGSGESFLKNSARSLTINFDPTASPQVITQNPDGSAGSKTVHEVVTEQVDNLNRNIDSALVTQGATAGTLQTSISDPRGPFEIAACTFAASVQIPYTVLFGQQTGRLASDEDKADMVARCKSRQRNELTPMLVQFVKRMQAAGIIEAGEFEIEWPPLDAPGDADKMAIAKQMADVNLANFNAGQPAAFDGNEIRAASGYEPRPELDGSPLEGDPGEGDDGDPEPGDPQARPALKAV